MVFLSGYSALVYELLWFRQLGLIFGNTVQAAATVLTAFMIGLAWGADRARRWSLRAMNPVRLFGLLEAGIGVYALIVPLCFSGTMAGYTTAARWLPESGPLLIGLRFALALSVLFVPTALMGASLPVLSEAALRSPNRFAARLGLLYGSNTLGATLGVVACGFYLVPEWGLRFSNLQAAAVNLLVGIVALWISRNRTMEPPPTEPGALPVSFGRRQAWLLAVAAACGFLALAFETAWFRALVLVLGSTSHSFAIMVACFLLGLVIGAAVLGRIADRPERAGWALAVALTGIGLWTLFSLRAYQGAPEFFLRRLVQHEFAYHGMLITKAAMAAMFLLPLAVFSGLAFTAVVRLIRDRAASSGQAVGAAFGVNALGSAAGSAVAGFVILPRLGLEHSLLTLGVIALGLGLVLVWTTTAGKRVPCVGYTAAVVAIAAALHVTTPEWDPLLLSSGPYFSPRTHVEGDRVVLRESLASLELAYYGEGTASTVSVTKSMDGRLHFSSDGKVEADTSPHSMVLQRMMGHLPMLLHPSPRKVLNIGLGAGVTCGALTCYPEAVVDVADIEPEVRNVARIWAARNHHVIERGRFQLFINDGRNHLLVTTNRYDVITSDPFEPVVAGAASLYTFEHFALARSRLAPGGMMAQFLPLYELSRDDLLMILRTFVQVFPRTTVFFTGTDTILLGLSEGAEIRLSTAAAKFAIPEVRDSLREVGMDRPERLLDMLVTDISPGGVSVESGLVNTDDRPVIEYSAQRHALDYRPDPNQQVLLRYFLAVPSKYISELPPPALPQVEEGRAALRAVLESSRLRNQGQLRAGVELLARAARQAPASPIVRNELVMSLNLLAPHVPAEEAFALYREALRVDPADFWAYYNFEMRARSEQRPDLAAEILAQGLQVFPDSAMLLAMRGRQVGLAGDAAAACRDLEAALRQLPRRADFWHIYADFLSRAGRTAEAVAARARAEKLSR